MNKELKQLIDKRFSVYEGDEFSRQTNFLGLMRLLANWSDFFIYTKYEQRTEIKKWIRNSYIYVDNNIYVTFK